MATRILPWQLDGKILDYVRLEAWDHLLFIECGDGWVAEEAWRRVARGWVCGISASTRLVDRAMRLRGVPGRLEFKLWDGESLPVIDGSIDRVIWCVPWRLGLDPALALREMARVLAADGDAYLLDYDECPGDETSAMLAGAGLESVAQYRCEAPSDAWGGHAVPIITHARLRTTELPH